MLTLASLYDAHLTLFVFCSSVTVSYHCCYTTRRMDQSPTQWRPHLAAQEASPTHPPPPSPPPPSPPSTRASSRNLSLMQCGLGTAGKVPSGSAETWRCKFPRKPGMSASVRGSHQFKNIYMYIKPLFNQVSPIEITRTLFETKI